MKIIKHGKLTDEQILHCPRCGCEFIPDNSEIYASISKSWFVNCPDCGTAISCNDPVRVSQSMDEWRRDRVIADIVESFEYIDPDDNGSISCYERIHAVMSYLGWVWASTNVNVPTIEEIKNESIRLMKEAWDRKTTISTGGFKVVYGKDENSKKEWLELSFELESICCRIDENNDILVY